MMSPYSAKYDCGRVQDEVVDYLRRLATGPGQALRVAIKALVHEKGDIKPLTDDLEGFQRLRIGSHRVVFEYEIIDIQRVITCVFAGSRKWIYEVFQSRVARVKPVSQDLSDGQSIQGVAVRNPFR